MPVAPTRSRQSLRVPLSKEGSEIVGQWGVEAEPIAGDGVGELKVGGMQELARRQRRPATAVDAIADDRVVDRGQVDADLVRSPRLKLQLEERAAPAGAHHAEARASLAPPCPRAHQ